MCLLHSKENAHHWKGTQTPHKESIYRLIIFLPFPLGLLIQRRCFSSLLRSLSNPCTRAHPLLLYQELSLRYCVLHLPHFSISVINSLKSLLPLKPSLNSPLATVLFPFTANFLRSVALYSWFPFPHHFLCFLQSGSYSDHSLPSHFD